MTRDEILNLDDRKIEKVPTPEWGRDVYVRSFSGTERDSFDQAITGEDGRVSYANLRAKLLVRCLCTEAGDRLFTDADADALGRKNAAALDRLFEVAQRLNGLAKGDVEKLVKN